MATLLALFSSLLWGTADYHGGKLSKTHPAIAVLGVTQAIGLVFGIGLVIVSGDFSSNAFGTDGYFIPGAMAGILGYCGLICLYAGLSTGRMGVVSPISGLSALIPVGYAYFVKGDRLTLILSIGATLAIVGAFLASGPELSQGLPIRPLILALGAAAGFGTALVFMAVGSQESALMTMVMMRATTLLVSLGILAKYRTLGGLKLKHSPILIFIGCADFLANLLLGVATTKGNLTLSMVLGALMRSTCLRTACTAGAMASTSARRLSAPGRVSTASSSNNKTVSSTNTESGKSGSAGSSVTLTPNRVRAEM